MATIEPYSIENQISRVIPANTTERFFVDTLSDNALRLDHNADGQPYEIEVFTSESTDNDGKIETDNYRSCMPSGSLTFTDTSNHTTVVSVSKSTYIEVRNTTNSGISFDSDVNSRGVDSNISFEDFSTKGTGSRSSIMLDGDDFGGSPQFDVSGGRSVSVSNTVDSPGVKITEDPVSPVEFDSESSISFTTENDYKELILLDAPNDIATFNEVQVFQNTGNNYDYANIQNGSETTGTDAFEVPVARQEITLRHNPSSSEVELYSSPMRSGEAPYTGTGISMSPQGYVQWDVTLKDSLGYDKTGKVVVLGKEVDGNA